MGDVTNQQHWNNGSSKCISSSKKRLLIVITLCVASGVGLPWLFLRNTAGGSAIDKETTLFPEQERLKIIVGNTSALPKDSQHRTNYIPTHEESEKSIKPHHPEVPKKETNDNVAIPLHGEEGEKSSSSHNSLGKTEQDKVETTQEYRTSMNTASTADVKGALHKTAPNDVAKSTATNDESESTATNDATKSTATNDESESTATNDATKSTATNDESESTATNDESESTATNDVSESTATNDATKSTATSNVTVTESTATTNVTVSTTPAKRTTTSPSKESPASATGVQISEDLHTVTNITVYVEMFASLDKYYPGIYKHLVEAGDKNVCPGLSSTACTFQTASQQVDVVFRQVGLYRLYPDNGVTPPYRYCKGQIVAVLNTEAELPRIVSDLQNADIEINYHPSSSVIVTDACRIPWQPELYSTPDPSERKGIALLMSNCNVQWRTQYLDKLARNIQIYSYGACLHNVKEPPSRTDFYNTFKGIASRHRMVLTFENTIQSDYISEKISLCFKSGVIPVYWGPPEIYQWVPGEHSFIDPQKFKGPEELAKYLRRVDEDDDLFRYHTTNFNYTLAKQTHTENCKDSPFHCQMCERAKEIKIERQKKNGQTPLSQSCRG